VSLVQINQLNRDDGKNNQKDLGAKIAAVFGNRHSAQHLIERCLKDTAVNLLATKGNMQEHRRILWNTYRNLELWFNTWEDNLVELGFAKFDEETKACKVHDNQLARILNIDESACSVDGANGQRGGRPSAVLSDPSLPSSGIATSKSNSSTTLITGASAAGDHYIRKIP
jgi:hypothetical protein